MHPVRKYFAQTKDRHLPGSSYWQARRQTHRCLPRRTRSVPTMRPSHAHPRRTSQGQTLRQERKTILPQKPRLNSSVTHKFCGTAVSSSPSRGRASAAARGQLGWVRFTAKRDSHLPLQGEGWDGDGSEFAARRYEPIPTSVLPLKGRMRKARVDPMVFCNPSVGLLKTKRCIERARFWPCPTLADEQRIACSAFKELGISPLSQNNSIFRKRPI